MRAVSGLLSDALFRRDLILACAVGPLVLGFLALLLSFRQATIEGTRSGQSAELPPVVLEVVGFAASAEPGRPILAGTGDEAGLLLHGAQVASRAALLLPPAGGGVWQVAPASVEGRVEVIGASSGARPEVQPWNEDEEEESALDPDEAVRIRGGGQEVLLRLEKMQVVASRADPDGPETLAWLDSEGDDRVTFPSEGISVVSCARAPGLQWTREALTAGSPAEVCKSLPSDHKKVGRCWWGWDGVCRPVFADRWGLRIENRATGAREIRSLDTGALIQGSLVILAQSLDPSGVTITWTGRGGPFEVAEASSGRTIATLGPAPLKEGDLLQLGSQRFLVLPTSRRSGAPPDLLLLHASGKRAKGFFPSSAGAELYHPNRLWNVPRCGGGDWLTLLVQHGPRKAPRQDDADSVDAAEQPVGDAVLRRKLAGASGSVERSFELPGTPEEPPSTGELSACAEIPRSGPWRLHLRVDRAGDPLEVCDPDCRSARDAERLELGTLDDPREILVRAGSTLLRAAPAAGRRVQQGTFLRLWLFLAAVVALQAIPLTWARRSFSAALDHSPAWAQEFAWPAWLGPPLFLQIAGICIASLLLIGGRYHLWLAAHASLAGRTDFIQSFLKGVLAVSLILSFTSWFTVGGQPLRLRLGWACAGTLLVGVLGALWMLWDAGSVPAGLWLRRSAAEPLPGWTAVAGLGLLTLGLLFALWRASRRHAARVHRPGARLPRGRRSWSLRYPLLPALAVFALICGAAFFKKSALAFQLGLLVILAWYGAVQWTSAPGERRQDSSFARWQTLRTWAMAVLTLLAGAVFLLHGLWWNNVLVGFLFFISCLFFCWGTAVLWRRIRSSQRMVLLLAFALAVGLGVAIYPFKDMGSLCAWAPSVFALLCLWIVRSEGTIPSSGDARRSKGHLLLAVGAAFLLLCVLDLARIGLQFIRLDGLERPRQRFVLSQDISYLIPGEWIARVRWLATGQEAAYRWVANMNSDVAIFGVAANLGRFVAIVLVSLVLLLLAATVVLASDQAFRAARASARKMTEAPMVWMRALGLFLGALAVLLVTQWLVHLSTGVAVNFPVTGLVLPWISHGNMTHFLYTAALTVPLALLCSLVELGPVLADDPQR